MLLFISAIPASAIAQRTITPFTPRVTDETGRKVYVQPQAKPQSKISVTLGYGFMPVTSRDGYAGDRFPFHYSTQGSAVSYPDGDITSTMGSISLGVNWEINPWLELNVPFVFSHSTGRQEVLIGGYDRSGGFKDNWYVLLPSMRINWMRNNWISIYSRVGIGCGFGNRWTSIEADQATQFIFAWQASPIGVEMGTGWFNFFIEGGYGFTGVATAGVKMKIGKIDKKTGKTSTGRSVDWYDKYMR